MNRTTWVLALVALAGLIAVAVAIGMAETPEGGLGAGGGFAAAWAAAIAMMRAEV